MSWVSIWNTFAQLILLANIITFIFFVFKGIFIINDWVVYASLLKDLLKTPQN
jgi:hypothetical protein